MSLVDLTVRLGGLAWVSAELFAVEGQWAERMESDDAVVHLATHSRHHGWHAQLLRELLPDSPSLDAHKAIVAPHGWSQALSLVSAIDHADGGLALLALYRHLVPRHGAAAAELQRSLQSPGDDAVARVLSFVVRDIAEDLLSGTNLLVSALQGATALGDAVSGDHRGERLREQGSQLARQLDSVFMPT